MREIEPLSEPILRLSQPLVSSIEIEENPIVLINAPVKNRNAIKVVARRQATFKAGPATQIDDSL
jgi:hypothetical protein